MTSARSCVRTLLRPAAFTATLTVRGAAQGVVATAEAIGVSRNVKGTLFADYVRMVRGHKGVDWARHLAAEDLPFIAWKIDPEGWYPMATFERLGNAILAEVASGNVASVRAWGRFSVPALCATHPTLLAVGDPVDTLRRFHVLRRTFFDFEALEVSTLCDDHARLVIAYHMGAQAEEAASYQTMGFLEGLLDEAGATDVHARFESRAWLGDARTVLALDWTTPRTTLTPARPTLPP